MTPQIGADFTQWQPPSGDHRTLGLVDFSICPHMAVEEGAWGNTMAEAEGLRKMLMDAFYDEHILGYGYLVDADGKNVYNPSRDHPLYRRFVSSLYCGTTEMVIEEFKRYEALGVEMIFLPSQQRELIAKEILPAFR